MTAPLRAAASLVLLVICATAVPAAADDDLAKARQFVHGSIDRARRAIAIGPMVGAGGSYALTPEDVEVPISFGLGLVLFDIPVIPSPSDIQEMITSRAKAKLTERLKAMALSGAPPPDEQELARITKEILTEVKDEILGRRPYTGHTLEKPRLAVALEGAYLPRAGAWQTRLTVGYGISKVTIGPTLAGHFGDGNGLYLGGELAIHLTPKRGPRSPVIDVFLRFDYGVTSATDDAHALGLGLRLLLDLI